MKDFHYIAIEGVLGVGKTTFARKLGEELQAKVILEQVDNNPFLEKFYKDMENHALRTQLTFLLNRVKQMEPLKQMELFQQKIVSDYIIEKDRIFAYITLGENELPIYEKIYGALVKENDLLRPDLVVYLQASIDILQDRIKKRGRVFEKGISKDYLYNLTQAYNYYFTNFTTSPLAIVNTDGVDFVTDKKAYELIKNFILNVKGGVNYYTPRTEK
ncbi:MAG: deoxynucleoside kinase [Spirochaetia bacterium]|nr:deoxynucleoside kinase [Spirochaetia bacterium]